jgi:hypothetical protein
MKISSGNEWSATGPGLWFPQFHVRSIFTYASPGSMQKQAKEPMLGTHNLMLNNINGHAGEAEYNVLHGDHQKRLCLEDSFPISRSLKLIHFSIH